MVLRNANASDIEKLATLWFDGWREAHAELVPPELARRRTLLSFRDRLSVHLDEVRVIVAADVPAGFCMTKGSELNQLYVSSEARGSGLAAALMLDAETRLRERGVDKSWLACAIGNARAARFYEKQGWACTGTVIEHLEAENGAFPLEVWRYEKSLR